MNSMVLLKVVGVVGPAVCFVLATYRIITKNGILSENTFAWLVLGSLIAGLFYFVQFLLFANFIKMPFYTTGLFCGIIISLPVFFWLMWALIQYGFSNGLHLLSLRGLIL